MTISNYDASGCHLVTACAICYADAVCFDDGEAYICVDRAMCHARTTRITPYYAAPDCDIYLGDMRAVLPAVVARYAVDLVLTDPPYGEIDADRHWPIVPSEYAGLLRCAPVVVSFASLPFLLRLDPAMRASGWEYWTNLVWVKNNGGFQISTHHPRMAHEHIVAYRRDGVTPDALVFNGYESGEQGDVYVYQQGTAAARSEVYGGRKADYKGHGHPQGKRWARSVIAGKEKPCMAKDARTTHPNQKPLETVERLILLFSNPGDLILDPFSGSGTTAAACKKLGRRFVGIEQDERYIEMTVTRLQQESMVLL